MVANLATGVSRSVTTDDDGVYTVINLMTGRYDVTATGFSAEIRKELTISVGDRTSLDLVLKVGEASKTTKTTIVVTGETSQVQLASSTISDVVNETTVREPPLMVAVTCGGTHEFLGKVPTGPGAGTSFWVPQLNRFYVAVPSSEKQDAAILVFEPQA